MKPKEFRHCFCNNCQLQHKGCLGKAGHRRTGSCQNHSPQHCCSGPGIPGRAKKLRSDGKGQQTLRISKAWAKTQPFIHYRTTRVTMQPFSVENLWPRPLSIVLISMKLKCVLRIKHFFAWCLQERESFLNWGQTCTLYRASSDPKGQLKLLRDSEGIFLIVQSLV